MKVLLKLTKTASAFFVIVLLVLSMSMSVLASSTIEMSKLGSITINKSGVDTGADGSLSGVKFTVYKVATLSNSGSYSLTSDFSASGLQLDALSTASAVSAASKSLASYVSLKNISGISSVTNSSGSVKFTDLTLGYYLAVQTDHTASQSACDPFLVAVPMKNSDGSSWIYNIVANTKCEAECGAVILEKTNASGTVLSGAVFRLENKVYYSNSVSMPAGVQTDSDSSGNYYWSTLVSELTTNTYGQIAVKSMPFGQYRFIETAAPSGYTLDSTPHEFTISAVGTVTLTGGKYVTASGTVQTLTVINSYYEHHEHHTESHSYATTSNVTSTISEVVSENSTPEASPTDTESVPDEKVPQAGFNLPKTGGSIAYAVCTYGGIILMMCGAAVFLVSRKKKV